MANIFRVVKDKNYTIVNNDYLKNKNLKVESIGLLTIILSLPPTFKITMKSLISITNEKANYRSIKMMLDNLRDNGYLETTKLQDEKGHFYFDYIFFENNSLNPLYKNYIVDSANQSIANIDNSNSPPLNNSPLVENCIDNINTNNIKINIDKSKLNLCFLTKYLIDWNFIKLNDINLFGYDNFLNNLLSEKKYTYDELMKVTAYVVTKIKHNNYLDENEQPINNLLLYFKASCLNNLGKDEKIEEWLKEVGML